MEIIAFISVIVAFILFALTPVAERRGGQSAATGLLVAGFLSLVFATVAGILSASLFGIFSALASIGMLAWSYVSYQRLQQARDQARNDKQSTQPPGPGANCASRKTSGDARVDGPDQETWRTYLFTVFSTSPSNGELKEFAKVWGGAYYGIYFTTGEVKVEPVVGIICEDAGQGNCLADGDERNPAGLNDPPVRVKVSNAITPSGSRVRVQVVMGAALNASGGPSVAIAPGGVGPTLSFPDASLDSVTPMGTYRWICENVEG